MGSSDTDSAAKGQKTGTAAQEQPPATSSTPAAPATPIYPDWSSFQAYSPIPPHGFFPSPVASGSPAHPYVWGPQPIMPPYGTHPPPYVMYPHGVYAHPSIPPGSHPFVPYAMAPLNGNAEASGAEQCGMEVDEKSPEGKEKGAPKRSKENLGSLSIITGKTNNDPGKTSKASADGGFSHSGESGSDSSEGSDADSQNDSQPKASGGQDSYDEASQAGSHAHSSQNGMSHTPSQTALNQTMPIMSMTAVGIPGGAVGPATNLNIGMEYWGATTPSTVPLIRAKTPATAVGGAMFSGAPSELWVQDERELKRQRRKQSNRESARRSRLRKQAECEELSQRVEVLKEENSCLRAELDQIRKEHDQLLSQNAFLRDKLGDTADGEEDPKVDGNGQHSLNYEQQRPLDSDGQSAQNNTADGGH